MTISISRIKKRKHDLLDEEEKPKKRKKRKVREEEYPSSDIRTDLVKEFPASKRRGLILRTLRRNVFGTRSRTVFTNLSREVGEKDKAKPEPRYFYEFHKTLRRKRSKGR